MCDNKPTTITDQVSWSSCAPSDSWADDQKYECDVGWQPFQASCYKLTSEKYDWETAQKTCQKMEANLISLHTLPELEFILRSLKKGDQSPVVLRGKKKINMTLNHSSLFVNVRKKN